MISSGEKEEGAWDVGSRKLEKERKGRRGKIRPRRKTG